MLVGNHSGGVALDGAMVIASMFFEHGSAAARAGHGREVHEQGAVRVAVDEPRRASSPACPSTRCACSRTSGCSWSSPRARAAPPSSTRSATRWCGFGTGFVRLALQTEDAHRAVRVHRRRRGHPHHRQLVRARASSSARPTCPITPYLLPLPLPVRLEVHYGEPMVFEGTGTEDDEVIVGNVEQVKDAHRRADRGGASHGDAATATERDDEGPGHRASRAASASWSPSGCVARGHEVIGIDRRPLAGRARGRRGARGRHPQARRRGRVPHARGPRR